MRDIEYEAARDVLDAIVEEATGEGLSMFLSWHGIDEEDYEGTVEYLYEAIEDLR